MTAIAPDARPLRVLAADDHPTNRAVIQVILGLIGAELLCVHDGAEAVDAFKHGDFDIVLMDLQMPVLDGYEAIREIRRYELETRRPRTPVLAVSANAMSNDIAASHAAGADNHIAKPVMPDTLLRIMAEKVAAAAPGVAIRSQVVNA